MIYGVVLSSSLRGVVDIETVYSSANHASRKYAKEDEAKLSDRESIAFRINARYRIEESVVYSVHKGGVQICDYNSRI